MFQWRLTALIRQLGRGFGYFKPQIVHRLVDGAARGQITTAAPRREPRRRDRNRPTTSSIWLIASSNGIKSRFFSEMWSLSNAAFAKASSSGVTVASRRASPQRSNSR